MVPYIFTLPRGRCHETVHIRMANQSPYELHANYVGHTCEWKTSYALMKTVRDTCLAHQARPHQRYWGKRRETRDLQKNMCTHRVCGWFVPIMSLNHSVNLMLVQALNQSKVILHGYNRVEWDSKLSKIGGPILKTQDICIVWDIWCRIHYLQRVRFDYWQL